MEEGIYLTIRLKSQVHFLPKNLSVSSTEEYRSVTPGVPGLGILSPTDSQLEEFAYSFTEIALIAVEIENAIQLHSVTAALVQAEINIHYIYSFITRPYGKSALAIRLEDNELAEDILTRNRLKVLSQADIAR